MADPIRVLHVEDDPEFASVTAEFLERESDRIDVATETHPADALTRVETNSLDCVVSDYDMPGMDGIEFLEAVRERDADVPFILFTGKGSEEVASDALSKGATDYLQKHAGTDQYTLLANRIENAVRQHRSVAALERQNGVLETAQEIADMGVAEYDVETDEWWFSEGIVSLLDLPDAAVCSPADVRLETILSYYHPEDRTTVESALEHTREEATSTNVDVRLDTDAERWVRVRARPRERDGAVSRIYATVQEITERRSRERERRRNERRFQAVFQDPEQLVGLLEPDGTLVDTNDTSLEYVEADRQAVRGDPFWETPWWDAEAPDEVRNWIERAADGEYVSYDTDLTRPDGTTFSVSGSIRPVRDDDGTVASLIVSARDVTDRRSSKRERAFFEALVEETTDIISVIDEDGTIRYQSPAIESVLGYEQGSHEGASIFQFVHPDEREGFVDWGRSFLADDREEASIEHRTRRADGTWCWIESVVQDMPDSPLDGLVVTSRDVTERTERERELETFEQIIEGLGESIFVMDEHGELTYVNPGGARVSGYDPAEIIEAGPALLYDEADLDRIGSAVRALVDSDDEAVVVESTLQRRDGTAVPVELVLSAKTDEDGTFDGAVGVVKDITPRRETERELREYESIIRAIPDEITILDTEGLVTRIIPPAGAETTASGYEPEELEGQHISTVMTDEDMQTGVEMIEELVTTDRERGAFEMQVVDSDGERHWREDNVALLEDDDGNVRGTVGILRDIEERKAYERELERQNERLEEFAEITSHDLRNPLNLALGYLEMVEDECDTEHTEKVRDALARMEDLIEDTLTMASQGSTVSERRELDLAEVAQDSWEAVGVPTATLTVADSAQVPGDEARLRQVIQNLLRNSIEHAGDDVSVRIGTLPDGFYVADDGPGIPTEERDWVFETGYTTSEDGTGFGLAIVGEIVEAHGWEITVTESDAGGVRFEVTGVEVG